jgi:hypothetical protein
MTTNSRFVFCVLALTLSLPAAWAGEEVPARKTGHVLVLANERTLEGDVDRFGDQYRVRRAQGELWVPAASVLTLCEDYESAYRYLHKQANLNDPDEHLRLAKWCQARNLRDLARKEVREALEQRPDDAAARRLLSVLEHGLNRPAGTVKNTSEAVENALAAQPVSTESLSLFVTKVQPLLMNACIGCHGPEGGSKFKLTRIYNPVLDNRRTMQANLTAVMKHLDKDRPLSSPFLVKSVTVHGDMVQPPLKNRETPAYRSLEEWVRATVQEGPQPQDAAVVAAPQPPRVLNPEPMPRKRVPTEAFASAQAPANNPSGDLVPAASGDKPTTTKPVAQPVDPYDPLIFNRLAHPENETKAEKQ